MQAVMGTLPIAAACSAELQGRVFRVLVRMVERHAQMMHGQEILLDSIAPGLTELVRRYGPPSRRITTNTQLVTITQPPILKLSKKTKYFTILNQELDKSRNLFASMTVPDMWTIMSLYNQKYAHGHIFATDSPIRVFTWKLQEDMELPVLFAGPSSPFTPQQFCEYINVPYTETSGHWDNYHTLDQIRKRKLDVKGWVHLADVGDGMGDEICLLPGWEGTGVPIEIVTKELPHEFFMLKLNIPKIATTPHCVADVTTVRCEDAQSETREILRELRNIGEEQTWKRRRLETEEIHTKHGKITQRTITYSDGHKEQESGTFTPGPKGILRNGQKTIIHLDGFQVIENGTFEVDGLRHHPLLKNGTVTITHPPSSEEEEEVRETQWVIRDGEKQKRTEEYFDGKTVMEEGTFKGPELTSGKRTIRNPDGSTEQVQIGF